MVEVWGQLGDMGGEGGVVKGGGPIGGGGGAGIEIPSQEDVSGGVEGADGVEVSGDGSQRGGGELGVGGGGAGGEVGEAQKEGSGKTGGWGDVEPQVGGLLAGVPLLDVRGEVRAEEAG